MNLSTNIIEFNLEDAYVALLKAASANFIGAPVVESMVVADLAVTHIAVIIERLGRSEEMPRSGNWKIDVHIKVVTAIDDAAVTTPGAANALRIDHKQRCGAVRDAIMVSGLAQLLNAAADTAGAQLTVNGYDFSDISHRIEGRSWVSEFVVHHANVMSTSIPR